MSKSDSPLYLMERVYLKDRTLSSLLSPSGGLIAKILERPWLNNARGVSCIPEDTYDVIWSGPVLRDDPDTDVDESGGRIYRPYEHYILPEVPGRSGILIHAGTDVNHSQGCLLTGSRFVNVNSPTPTLGESRAKLAWMTANMPKKWRLLIEAKSGTPYK